MREMLRAHAAKEAEARRTASWPEKCGRGEAGYKQYQAGSKKSALTCRHPPAKVSRKRNIIFVMM